MTGFSGIYHSLESAVEKIGKASDAVKTGFRMVRGFRERNIADLKGKEVENFMQENFGSFAKDLYRNFADNYIRSSEDKKVG